MLEQNDEIAVKRARYVTLESITPVSDDPIVEPPRLPGGALLAMRHSYHGVLLIPVYSWN